MKSAQTFAKRILFKTLSPAAHPKHYARITWEQANLNKEYKSFVEAAFREQGARLIQRAYRKHQNKTFTGKYTETLNAPLSLRFIREPYGLKYKEHAKHINNNEWYKLDFNDEDFVRNISKAFRLSLISEENFATANLLFAATEEFKDDTYTTLKQMPCDAKGGCGDLWSPAKVSYIKESELKELSESELPYLPESEKNYFIINLSRQREISFLIHWLMRPNLLIEHQSQEKVFEAYILHRINWQNEETNNALRKLVNVAPSVTIETLKQHLINLTKQFSGDNSNIQNEARKKLLSFLRLHCPQECKRFLKNFDANHKTDDLEKRDRDYESSLLLANFFDCLPRTRTCIFSFAGF